MSARKYILAVDQGTTSTKALVIAEDGNVIATSAPGRFEVEARYPHAGWVEYDPYQIWETVRASAQAALRNARLCSTDIAGVGLANQGETVIAFDVQTGRPVYPAISWQDRRGEELIARWRADGLQSEVFARTGLRLDSYFSAPKLAWILRNVDEARKLHSTGRLCLGTSDAWLLWQLTGGGHFLTDVSTASRTMLLDLESLDWSVELARSFGLPISALPELCPNAMGIGQTSNQAFGAKVPVTGLCVDQQAALFGQQAFAAGQSKITYGTGCFLLANIGGDASRRVDGLSASVGWQIDGQTDFVLEGGVYSAGSVIEWLVELGLVTDLAQIGKVASEVDGPSTVTLVPAFGGLAAPRWSGRARACWLGMDQRTDQRHLIRSALEAIAFRVREIRDDMDAGGVLLDPINVDGGLTQCDLLLQIQADVLRVPLTRRDFKDSTALGVGYLAGLGSRLWDSPSDIPELAVHSRVFQPRDSISDDYELAFQKWKRICSAVVEMADAGLFDR